MLRLLSTAKKAFASLLCLAIAATPALAAVCFTARQDDRLPFRVVQEAPPPVLGERNYPYFPLTDAATAQIERLWEPTLPGVSKWYNEWANRCQGAARSFNVCGWNPKGNLGNPRISGRPPVRSFFATFAMADACTLAQAAYALGENIDPSRYAGSGMRIEQGRERPLLQTRERLVDTCEMPAARLPPDAAGILLDYEVQDGRSPSQTLAFLREFARLVHAHGKRAILYTNPLDAPTQRYTGITAANAHAVMNSFDFLTIVLWSRNRQHDIGESFRAQLDTIRAGGPVNPRKLLAVYELNGTTVEDAKSTRALLLASGLAGVVLWRDHARQGGDCDAPTNQKIACLLGLPQCAY
jgi:hypothetical protein